MKILNGSVVCVRFTMESVQVIIPSKTLSFPQKSIFLIFNPDCRKLEMTALFIY